MTWAWGDPVTDPYDVSMVNAIVAAANERACAFLPAQVIVAQVGSKSGQQVFPYHFGNGMGNGGGHAARTETSFGYPPPALAAGFPNKTHPVPGVEDDPLSVTLSTSLAWFAKKSLLEVQAALGGASGLYVDHATYPDGYAGLPASPAPQITYAVDRLKAMMGYPARPYYPSPYGSTLYDEGTKWTSWRRKCPRRIFSITGNSAPFHPVNPAATNDGYYASNPSYWTTSAPYVVGNLAQYYVTAAITGAQSYRGVYEYRGGGTWTRADDRHAVPDVLDSNEAYFSNLWTRPSTFSCGDYFGAYLWEDVIAFIKLLRRTTDGSANKLSYAQKYYEADYEGQEEYSEGDDENEGELISTEDLATVYGKAKDALHARIASDTQTAFINGVQSYYTPSGSSTYHVFLRTQLLDGTALNYQRLGRTVEWYASPRAYDTFLQSDNLGGSSDDWYLMTTAAFSAGSHGWSGDTARLLDTPDPVLGTPYVLEGSVWRDRPLLPAKSPEIAAVITWDFEYP